MECLGYIALIGVGIILGLTGGGGSVLSMPVLVYLFSIDVVAASAYSLFMVGITSMTGALVKQQEHFVDTSAGLWLGVPSMIASFSTRKWIVCAIPDVVIQTDTLQITKREVLLSTFAVLVVLSSLLMIFSKIKENAAQPSKGRTRLVPAGLIIGFLSGLAGMGGGFIILPALIVLGRLSFHKAAGTALFVIAINSLLGFMGDVMNYSVNWFFLLSVTAFAIAGIFIGNRSARLISGRRLQTAFGWITLGVGFLILIMEW